MEQSACRFARKACRGLLHSRKTATEKFVLVVGADPEREQIIFHDPSRKNGATQKRNWRTFFESCRLGNEQFVKIRLGTQWDQPAIDKLNQLVGQSRMGRKTDADFAQHIMKLKKKLPNKNFHIVLQRPFVVVGDELSQTVNRRATGTVKWAVDKLKQDYFSRDPLHIVDIWLV